MVNKKIFKFSIIFILLICILKQDEPKFSLDKNFGPSQSIAAYAELHSARSPCKKFLIFCIRDRKGNRG